MGARKKKKKRDKKKRRRPQRPGISVPGFLGKNVAVVPSSGEKMSAVLLEFMEPYSHDWRDEEDLKKLLSLVVLAWNAALLTGSDRDKVIEDTVHLLPPELRPEMRAHMNELIQRKLTHFADNRRMILNFELTMTASGPHVTVLSTLA